jgi:hypothetical protein
MGFLRFNAYDVLNNYGKVIRDTAERRAIIEYEKYRIIQDKEFKSDFDKVVDEIKVKKTPSKTRKQIKRSMLHLLRAAFPF